MRSLSAWLCMCVAACAGTAQPAARPAGNVEPIAPIAQKIPEVRELHGERRVDDYAWLKDKGSPRVEDYLRAENAYSDALLRPLQPLRDKLYAESLARVQETDTSAAYPSRGYLYYSRTQAGLQYPIHCRKPLGSEVEEVLLDVNELGKNQKFVRVSTPEVSLDNQKLAYTVDVTGFRQYTLYVKDLRSGALAPESIPNVTSVTWAADNQTLFYTTEDGAKRSYRLYRHRLGTPVAGDPLIFEESDARFELGIGRMRGDRYLELGCFSHTTTEIRLLDAAQPTGEFRVILPRKQDIEYEIQARADSLFLRINDTGRTFRLVEVPLETPADKSRWVERVPMRPDVMLSDADVFQDFYVLSERSGGLPRLRSVDFATGRETSFAMPEQDYLVSSAENEELNTQVYRYLYMSKVTPPSTYERDVKTGEARLVKREPVPTYDASRYETARVEATASDGTKIPISLAMKKGVPRDGSAGMLLNGYGAYGFPSDAYFKQTAVSYMDRGVILATAHIRGGGELGKPWHDAGRMLNKKNTFSDFIAAAEYLVAQHWTTHERLAINGGSAGGLLMGAVLNARPELFNAALVEVPFVDVTNTMLDETLPLTVGEFEEWGNPKLPGEYAYINSYSPYDNIRAQAYPAILVRSSYNDSQVLYHEPAKYVAKLRALKTDKNPLLLKMEMDPAGHGGRSGRYDELKDHALYQAWLLWQLGIHN